MPKPTTAISNQVTPDPSLEKRTRRTFSADYKLRIIRQADACQHGELGPLLRKEKLYPNQISQWRRELEAEGIDGLSKSAPGPRSALNADQKRIIKLEKENQRLRREVAIKDDCLDLQKKALSLLDQLNSANAS
jgi:transposase-like protein